PSIDLFAPDCLRGSRARRARLQSGPDELEAALGARSRLTLHIVQELLGEAVYDIERRLPGVEVVEVITDQLGRAGHGLRCFEHGERMDLIFSSDTSQMLGYQWFLA